MTAARAFGLAAVVALAVLPAAAARRQAPPAPAHVTFIGDSIGDAIIQDPGAQRILGKGVDLDLEVAICRRVSRDSCPYNGVRPPNVVELTEKMGSRIGPTVVVEVGYNDPEDEYAEGIEDALQAFRKAGVKRVLWLTLRAARHPYVNMNADIAAAAARHPEMTIVDWNLYSRSHPDWFQDDGIHLSGVGPQAMAELSHKALVKLGVAPRPVRVATKKLPAAVRGKRYLVRLRAGGGRAPFTWTLRRGPLPSGLRLRPTGWIVGRPTSRAGSFAVGVRVADSAGSSATRRLVLRVRR